MTNATSRSATSSRSTKLICITVSSTSQALDIVQHYEEEHVNDASTEADREASASNYDAANEAADESEDAATNASSLEEANS